MEVSKVTLGDGFYWYDVRDEGFRDRVRAAQMNRNAGLDGVDLLEMTEAEFHAIPATNQVHAATSVNRRVE
jgi:hypothetical protein